jgi:hypothetical protein
MARLKGWDEEAAEEAAQPGGKFSYAKKLETYHHQVEFKLSQGWSQEDAEAHTALSGVTKAALSEALRAESTVFAASSYALVNCFEHAVRHQQHPPPRVYVLLHGSNGVAETVDERFASLRKPDANGFHGFTCMGEAFAYDNEEMFPGDGLPPRERKMNQGVLSYDPLPPDVPSTDVVAFISRKEDDAGLHSAVKTTAEGAYRMPPLTLFVLARYCPAGEWEVRPGVRPACGCLEVTFTYAAVTAPTIDPRRRPGGAGGKMVVGVRQPARGTRACWPSLPSCTSSTRYLSTHLLYPERFPRA